MVTHSPPMPTAVGARALYLGAGEHKRVTSTDEALVVSNSQKQTLRYPVARLARIVSSPLVDWSGGALALCMRRGISVTWLDAKGQALGSCCPRVRSHLSFATALELMLEDPDGYVRYQHWLRSRRMKVLIQWGSATGQLVSPQLWESTKREWVYGTQLVEHLPRRLRGHCQAWVTAQLLRHQLPPILWGPQGEAIDLDEDLAELLWAEMNLHSGSLADSTESEREQTQLFERWNARNGAALLVHINSLQRTARREAYT